MNVYGDCNESYNIVPNLLNVIQEESKGTTVERHYAPTNSYGRAIFDRVFWTFGPYIKAF